MQQDILCKFRNSLNWDWSESTFSSVNLLWTPHNLEAARWSRLSLDSDISSRHINTSWELTVTVSPPGDHQIIIIGAPTWPLWHDTGTGAREVSVSLLFMASSSYKEIYTIWGIFIRIITWCLCKPHPHWQMFPISIHWHEPQSRAEHSRCMPG